MSKDSSLERYSRQMRFAGIGEAGQRKLLESRVTLCGCGALGTVLANVLVRAGVGHLRIVDRDFIETHNLQRQVLFDEHDVAENLPKAEAAARKLSAINSSVHVEPVVTDIDRTNIIELTRDADLILVGTDNFEIRYLINDVAVKTGKPWVYGGSIGSHGQTMTILPGETPCLRCVFPETPPAASAPTCDTAGVIMPIISVVAAVQVSEALKLLVGQTEDLHRSLMQFDVWRNEWRRIALAEKSADCATCALRRFATLDAVEREFAAVLCGRHAVQVSPAHPVQVDLSALSHKLQSVGEVKANDYLLRFRTGDYELTVFADARSIIRGTDNIATARSLYAKYIGN